MMLMVQSSITLLTCQAITNKLYVNHRLLSFIVQYYSVTLYLKGKGLKYSNIRCTSSQVHIFCERDLRFLRSTDRRSSTILSKESKSHRTP